MRVSEVFERVMRAGDSRWERFGREPVYFTIRLPILIVPSFLDFSRAYAEEFSLPFAYFGAGGAPHVGGAHIGGVPIHELPGALPPGIAVLLEHEAGSLPKVTVMRYGAGRAGA